MPSFAHRASTAHRASSRRRLSATVTASLLAVLLATGATPGGSASAEPGSPPAATNAVDSAGAVDLTLVTGDTVHVTVGADGRQTATVTPAPRPDGSSPGFWTHQRDGDLYVVPQDVAGLVPRRLDPELFNVSALAERGYADADSGTVPLIVTYRPGARPRAQAVPSSGPVRQLESVNGLALRVDKDDDAAAVGAALHRLADLPRARTLTSGGFAGVDKIWLDRPVSATLDRSVAQVGAPAAWQQGYDGTGVTVAVLDSGIDAEHPDLADRVVAARNFSDSDTTDDRAGHGTHVASTIAGSGAASGGRFTGVAPGVELINGKVLNDFGFGSTSAVIDGMEWAAQQGADIVNVSLGVRGFASDGTDPGAVAVNRITEQYGTLFVVSAGNDGPGASTINTPGAADRALTVGAVDRNEQIAGFSSRGPRAGDGALKPDITAPGVAIVAARAGGTSMGEPFDDFYTAESGTSMAAPHVAGVAALVAQARPDLDATRLKALLMATASPNDALTVFEQGAGRVDTVAALAGTVVSDPPSVSFGDFSFPHDQRGPVTRTVTYTNLGDQPQSLELAVDVENGDGEPAPAGSLALSADTLTIAAGGSATVTVTLDTRFPGAGLYGGAVVARTAGGDLVRTTVGYQKEPERYNVRVEGIARDGRPAYGRFRVLDVIDGSVNAFRSWEETGDGTCTTAGWAQSNCLRVPPGTYSVTGLVFTMPSWAPSGQPPGQSGSYLDTTVVAAPEVTIDGPTTLTMDAREAVEVRIDTPDHVTGRDPGAVRQVTVQRSPENGAPVSDGMLFSPRDQSEQRLFLQPTDPVAHGAFEASTTWQIEAPAVTMAVAGSGGVRLDPVYYDPFWFSDNSWQFPRLDGSRRLPVVDAGTATAAELEGRDLGGALALVRRSDEIPVAAQSNNAADAGAAMVAVYNDVPGSNPDPGGTGVRLLVPTVRLPHADGVSLLALLGRGPVTVEATGRPVSPYRYNLFLVEEGQIRQDPRYVADTDQLAVVENSFHGQPGDDLTLTEGWYAMRIWDNFALSFPMPTLGGPRTRTDYYVPRDDTEYGQNLTTPEQPYNFVGNPPPQAEIQLQGDRQILRPGEAVRRSWFEAPLRPGLWPRNPVQRSGDLMTIQLAAVTDGAGNVAETSSSWFEGGFTTLVRVFADGELLVESDVANGLLPVPADSERFRIEYAVDNAAPWARLSTRTSSVWTFGSGSPGEGVTRVEPLLTVDYDVDVDLHNRLPAPADRNGPHTVGLTVGHQPGAPDIPIRGNASLAVSYDGGSSWRAIPQLRQLGQGRFVATLPPVAPRGNDGFVSLRFRAEDVAGNTIEQEIIHAYALPPR